MSNQEIQETKKLNDELMAFIKMKETHVDNLNKQIFNVEHATEEKGYKAIESGIISGVSLFGGLISLFASPWFLVLFAPITAIYGIKGGVHLIKYLKSKKILKNLQKQKAEDIKSIDHMKELLQESTNNINKESNKQHKNSLDLTVYDQINKEQVIKDYTENKEQENSTSDVISCNKIPVVTEKKVSAKKHLTQHKNSLDLVVYDQVDKSETTK